MLDSNNPPTSAHTDELDDAQLLLRLEAETRAALGRVYHVDNETPLDLIDLPGGCELTLKREDLSKVHSYKWRGAFNKIASMHEQDFSGTMVAASAGNHAQGVAVAARRLKLPTTIFMPRSTPLVKQDAVRDFGGEFVEIRLFGDSFEAALAEAKKFATETNGAIIPPYDDLLVIAGQSTIGEELANTLEHAPTHAFLAIGGGGMAAGVSSVFKRRFPDTRLIAVEAVDQNSLHVSVTKGEVTTIDRLDPFCDGTAVARPGELPFRICNNLIHEYVTVTNDQVCEAIEYLWQKKRTIVEPSAALGVAAAIQYDLKPDDRPVTVLSGSNVDFMMLPKIAQRSQARWFERRYYAFEIDEKRGAMIGLLDNFLTNMNIIDFQYGKVADQHAYPVIGVEVRHSEIEQLETFLADPNIPAHHEVTGSAASEFRVIPFNVDLLDYPFFAVIEFSNRPGALGEFMRYASELANVCYMNYTDTGQTEGYALMGFEFGSIGLQSEFLDWLQVSTRFQVVPMEDVKHFDSSQDTTKRWQALRENSK